MSEPISKCPVCGKTADQVKLLRCSACRVVSYCSVDHQKQGKLINEKIYVIWGLMMDLNAVESLWPSKNICF